MVVDTLQLLGIIAHREMARDTGKSLHRSRSPRRGRREGSKNPATYDINKSFRKSHQRRVGKDTDGELFTLMRLSMAKKDGQRTDEYRNRLSRSKQISLKGLLQRVYIAKCLDDLRIYPGVLDGLELGNVHKHLGLHCDPYIIQFLGSHIQGIWSKITGGDTTIQQYIRPATVQRLQFRAPSASSSDRRMIVQMFESGDIFGQIADARAREQVKQNVLALKVVIPSVETFHENMKFFSIGMKIIRSTIADSVTRETWLEVFLAEWRPPAVSYIETSQGHLKPLAVPKPTVQLAFLQLFLSALRNFPYLCSEYPRQDRRGESMPAYPLASMVLYLRELASALGFRSRKIRNKSTENSARQTLFEFQPGPGLPADWRGGKPFTKTFFILRSQAFLLKLSKPMAQDVEPSALFILQDFIKAFFGDLKKLHLDRNRPSIRLTKGAASETYTSLAGDSITRARQSRMTKRRAERKSLVTKRKAELANKRKYSHGEVKEKVMTRRPGTKALSDRQSESCSVTPSTDVNADGTSETFFARPLNRSPILTQTGSTRQRLAEEEFSPPPDRSGPEMAASTVDLHTRGLKEPTSVENTLHRTSLRSPMGGSFAFGPRLSNVTTQSTPTAQVGWFRPSTISHSTGGATVAEPHTMPSRIARSKFGQGFTRDHTNSPLTVRIPPIRSMRSARQPRLSQASMVSPTMQPGAEDPSQEKGGRLHHGFPFGRRTGRTRAANSVVQTPLRPEASSPFWAASLGGEAARTPLGTPSDSDGERHRTAGRKRHAVYIPSDSGQPWRATPGMPFERPFATTTRRD